MKMLFYIWMCTLDSNVKWWVLTLSSTGSPEAIGKPEHLFTTKKIKQFSKAGLKVERDLPQKTSFAIGVKEFELSNLVDLLYSSIYLVKLAN